jgi:hypothetical protein
MTHLAPASAAKPRDEFSHLYDFSIPQLLDRREYLLAKLSRPAATVYTAATSPFTPPSVAPPAAAPKARVFGQLQNTPPAQFESKSPSEIVPAVVAAGKKQARTESAFDGTAAIRTSKIFKKVILSAKDHLPVALYEDAASSAAGSAAATSPFTPPSVAPPAAVPKARVFGQLQNTPPAQFESKSLSEIVPAVVAAGKKQSHASPAFDETAPAQERAASKKFQRAPLKSQKGLGLGTRAPLLLPFLRVLSHLFLTGRLTGRPIGGEEGRAVKRAIEDAAAAMPQPLSEASKEILRTMYVQGYADIGITRNRKDATIAVGNIKKKVSGAINVRNAACLSVLHPYHPPLL